MSTGAIDALHDIHTATNDVLKGYREMTARAQPEVQTVIRRLTVMHERHAVEQADALGSLREGSRDDSSLQGSVNKAVVMVRDWLTDLDRDVLPAVRQGEESLRDKYDKALGDGQLPEHSPVGDLLLAQRATLNSEIARLPRD